MMLAEFWQSIKALLENRVVRNISLAVTGTAIAQSILVAVLPVLTRIYEPSDFSLLAVYSSLTSLLVVVACGRFDLAIPLPERNEDGISLLVLSLIAAAVFCSILAILYVVWGDRLLDFFSLTEFQPYGYLVPLGTFLAACNQCFEYWFARTRGFGFLAKMKVGRAFAGAGTQVSLGSLLRWPAGLILGQVVFAGVGAVGQGARFLLMQRSALKRQSVDAIKKVARDYARFPILSGPEAIFNKIGIHAPVLIVAAASIGPEAGYLMLAMRVLSVPVSLLGVSVQQVYLSEAPEQFRAGQLKSFTFGIQRNLLKIAFIPMLLIGGLSPFVTGPLFGVGWERAGWIILWLTPAYFAQFLISPVSSALHVVEKTGYAAVLQLVGCILRVASVLVISIYYPSFIIEVYAMSGLVFYLLYHFVVWFALNRAVSL